MRNYTWIIILLLIIVLGGVWYWESGRQHVVGQQTATSTPSGTSSQTTSDGTITFSTPADFALAVTPEQVLVKSYIPPCEQNFNYCLYYNGSDYKGTNFESAGLTIAKRGDLASEQTCLQTPPQGYDASIKPNNTTSTSDYATSVFENVGDAAAGHFASGALYRLFVRKNAACYEFLLRIGETDYANYPVGAIKEFTDADKQTLGQELMALLGSMTLHGNQISWPSTK